MRVILSIGFVLLLGMAIRPVVLADDATDAAKARFLKLCDLGVAELNKEITPFEQWHRKAETPSTHHVPFFVDSYAVRALCVAYDMTGDKRYLDACTHWTDRVMALQKKMIPKGAYYPNYGDPSRQPGQDHGDWWAADCGSIGMGVLAVAVRTRDQEQKARYIQSVRDFADLVIKNFIGKDGGITDGFWSQYAGEWYCSTALDGAMLYLLYEETKEPEYLRAATGAMNWLLPRDFHEMEPLGFKESPAHVVFYVFEFYAVGLKYLEPGSDRRRTAESHIKEAMQWLAENQKGRGAKSPRDYMEKDTYMAGTPYVIYAFARQMPEYRDLAKAADQELDYVTGLLLKDGDPPTSKIQSWELLSWTMMSYAEKLSPAAILRGSSAQAGPVQATFDVAPGGSDDNPGTQAKPFATIEKARQAVRALNKDMSGDIVVVLGDGTYPIGQTIVFDSADSGSGGHDVIYRAAPHATPVLSGGRRITGWQPDTGKRWKAATDPGDFRQLYVDGKRAIRARSGVLGPNADPSRWEFLADMARGGELPGAELVGKEGYRTTAVEMADWRNVSDLEFCYIVTWAHMRCKVQSIARQGDHAVVTMLQPYFTHAISKEGVQAKLPTYMENALELLDEPGEWYLDRPAKRVYYMPRPGEDMSKIDVIAPAVETLMELRGTLEKPVSHLRFEGVTFRQAGWLRPSKIGHCEMQANFIVDSDRKDMLVREYGVANVHNEYLKSPANVVCHAAKSICFERCTFRQLGGAGLDIEYGSQDNVVSGCQFFDISGSAIQIGDVLTDDHHPDDPRKIVKNNRVVNCYIHDCALEYLGGVGVFAGYAEGTVIAQNQLCRLPYSGISVGWGWGEQDAGGGNYKQPFFYKTPTPAKNNRVEGNHVHDMMQPMHDGGAIYTLGNMPGTVVRGNHIHDIPNYFGGIYLDEGSGFIEVTGNLVYRVSKPMNYNNRNQNRIATCREHDNFFDVDPKTARPIVERAGLEPEYRDLLRAP